MPKPPTIESYASERCACGLRRDDSKHRKDGGTGAHPFVRRGDVRPGVDVDAHLRREAELQGWGPAAS